MRKFNYVAGFWGTAIAASLLFVGLTGATITGAVNSTNRDTQLVQEHKTEARLNAKIDDLQNKLDDQTAETKSCMNAASYASQAYDTLRTALVSDTLTASVIAEINQYITEAQNAGCGSGPNS